MFDIKSTSAITGINTTELRYWIAHKVFQPCWPPTRRGRGGKHRLSEAQIVGLLAVFIVRGGIRGARPGFVQWVMSLVDDGCPPDQAVRRCCKVLPPDEAEQLRVRVEELGLVGGKRAEGL